MSLQLRALFNQPIGAGLAINELDQLLDLIQKAYAIQINMNQVDQYMEQNFGLKLFTILQSIYNYDLTQTLNKTKYNAAKFKQLLIFAQIQSKKLALVDKAEEKQYIFVMAIHIAIKYYNQQSKLIGNFISTVFEQFRDEGDLLEALLSQITESMTKNIEQIMPTIFILDHLLHFLYDLRILDSNLQHIIEQTFKILTLDYRTANLQFGVIMSNIMLLSAQKIYHSDSSKLENLFNQGYVLQFLQFYMFSHEQCTSNILQILSLNLKYLNKLDSYLYCQTSLFGQLIQQQLPQIITSVLPKTDQDDKLRDISLKFIIETIQSKYCYDFYQKNYQQLFIQIILPNLSFTADDMDNFHENPQEFYETVQSILEDQDDFTKGIIASMLKTLVLTIDGSLKFVFDFTMELLLFILQRIDDTPICNNLGQELLSSSFFIQVGEEDINEKRYSTLMMILILLRDRIIVRKDLRHQLEHFLKGNLKQMKDQVDGIGRCLGVELIKRMLPYSFKSMENAFKKCIKFTFKLLNRQGQKRCVKIFVIEFLKFMIMNESVQLRFEEVLTEFIQDICDQASRSDLEVYYEFLLKVLEYCNSIVDLHLDRIMKALSIRISLGCKKQQQSSSTNHASIVYNCISIIDQVLSMKYCLKYSAQIEPYLLEITQELLNNQQFDFIDEIFDADARYIGYTKGLTELMHLIFDKLPNLMENSNKITISSLFRLYMFSIIYASEVMKSKPQWIELMIDYLYKQLTLTQQSSGDLIKICLLIQSAYQYFNLGTVCVQITQQFGNILSQQIETKDILAKVFIGIFMPVILDQNLLIQFRPLLMNASGYMNMAFAKPLTIYNYKFLFLIFNILITQSHLLYEEQNRQIIVEQLFSMFLSRYAAYVDKVTFNQTMGEQNIVQKITNKIDNFDLEFSESTLECQLKEMTIYKQESQIEKPYNEDLQLLPLMNVQTEIMVQQNIVKYLNQHYGPLMANLKPADHLIITQMMQMQIIDYGENDTAFRQVLKPSKRKNLQQKQKFNAM